MCACGDFPGLRCVCVQARVCVGVCLPTWSVCVHVPARVAVSPGSAPEVGGGRVPTGPLWSKPHLALALPVGFVAVGVEAFAHGTVARSAHGVPPPAFGARKVDPVGKRNDRWQLLCNCPLQHERMPVEAWGPGWPTAGYLLPL